VIQVIFRLDCVHISVHLCVCVSISINELFRSKDYASIYVNRQRNVIVIAYRIR